MCDFKIKWTHLEITECWALAFMAQSTVLLSNMATVIGPTPPGTGVIHEATSFAEL